MLWRLIKMWHWLRRKWAESNEDWVSVEWTTANRYTKGGDTRSSE